jgi:hypothetical protein
MISSVSIFDGDMKSVWLGCQALKSDETSWTRVDNLLSFNISSVTLAEALLTPLECMIPKYFPIASLLKPVYRCERYRATCLAVFPRVPPARITSCLTPNLRATSPTISSIPGCSCNRSRSTISGVNTFPLNSSFVCSMKRSVPRITCPWTSLSGSSILFLIPSSTYSLYFRLALAGLVLN